MATQFELLSLRLTGIESALLELSSRQEIKIGDIFTTTISLSPAEVAARHGYGTWQRYAEGRTLVGFSTKASDLADYKIMGNEFGANTHTLTIEESANHKHSVTVFHELNSTQQPDIDGYFATNSIASSFELVTHDTTQPDNSKMVKDGTGNSLGSTGGDQPHNNIQPSKVVAHWIRVA